MTLSAESIAGRFDRPPWCPHLDCRGIAHTPVEFHHPEESGFCVGQMAQPRTTVVPYDPVSGEHRNTHWLCIHSPVSGTDVSQITAGDMALLAEVLLAALKDAQEGRLNWAYFMRIITAWERRP
ncbi:MAG: hypothetical protein ABIH46_07460 [Chloroflexota bacterium]